MDKKQLIGLILIFGMIFLFTWINSPEKNQIPEAIPGESPDQTTNLQSNSLPADTSAPVISGVTPKDSAVDQRSQQIYGEFSSHAAGDEQVYVLENDLIKVTFSNKGGRIKEAMLKEHKKLTLDENKKEIKKNLRLLSHEDAKFEYLIPVQTVKEGMIGTGDLFFNTQVKSNSLTFEISGSNGAVLKQIYTISPDNYTLDYHVETQNFQQLLDRGTKQIELNWVDYLDKIEKNSTFEQTSATLNFRVFQGDKDRCSYSKEDVEDLSGTKLEWVSNTNQFFSSILMVKNDDSFNGGVLSVKPGEKTDDYLKICESKLFLPLRSNSDLDMDMAFYLGPNDFDRLKAFNNKLEETIGFGSSIIGTINRWVIRPLFVFFLDWTNSAGIAILLLIFLVKMALYPLTYKMLKSSAKMGVLKPEISQIKEKYKNDAQTTQMKTMELYRKFGVSPFGGCMPMILQMPIWFALFRFFPAAIEFRQRSFLWAPDLSSYDVLFYLPFEIPMFGAHVSLFALLWTLSTLLYTYYNAQNMDLGNNPAMKYMQYIMPVFFIVFFNSYASGLTAYMFFSNIINVLQTIVTKKFVFDDAKIRAELEVKKDKPKKKNSFSQRLEDAMKQQQKLAEERAKQKKR